MRGAAVYFPAQQVKVNWKFEYFLLIIVLVLLPLERIILPFNLKIVDITLIFLTIYGLLKISLTNKRLFLPLIFPFWLILIASSTATLLGLRHIDSAVAILQETYLFLWFVVLTNILVRLTPSLLNSLLKIWAFVAIPEAVVTIFGMLGIGSPMFYTSPIFEQVISSGSVYRGIGTFVNANAAAAYLSISFFILLATDWRLWIKVILGLTLLIGVFATGSLGALFSTLIAFLFLITLFFAVGDRKKIELMTIILSFGLGIFVMFLFVSSQFEFISLSTTNTSDFINITFGRMSRSLGDRVAFFITMIPVFLRYPFGTGPNTSILIINSMHNDYFAYFFERGFLGAAGWICLVLLTIRTSLSSAFLQVNPKLRWQILSLGGGFIACAINAFTHEVSHFRQLWLLMAFVFATSFLLRQGWQLESRNFKSDIIAKSHYK